MVVVKVVALYRRKFKEADRSSIVIESNGQFYQFCIQMWFFGVYAFQIYFHPRKIFTCW